MEYIVTKITQTCSAAPAQWEGELECGRMFYIRYRHEWLSVRVSKDPTINIQDAVDGEEILGDVDYDFHGFGTTEDLAERVQVLDFSKLLKEN